MEIGCGQGELLKICVNAGLKVRGWDVSAQMVEACRQQGLPAELVDDALVALETCDPWDTLVLVDVLEHFTRDEALSLVRIARARGQRLVIQVPNMASPFAPLNLYHDLTHEWAYTEASIGQLLKLGGFEKYKVLPAEYPRRGIYRVRSTLRHMYYWLVMLVLVVDQPNRSKVLTPNLIAVADS